MDLAKATGWLITGLFILFALWLGSLVLGIGLGILNAALSIVVAIAGAVFSLLFSKNVLTLAAIGLVVFVIANRNKSERCYRGYHY